MTVRSHVSAISALAIGGALIASACTESPTRPNGIPTAPSGATSVTRQAEGNFFELCKDYSGTPGPAVTFNVSVDQDNNGSIDTTFTVSLSNGQCQDIWSDVGIGRDIVTVTEQVPTGYSASFVRSVVLGGVITTDPSVAGNVAVGPVAHADVGTLVVFTNTAGPGETDPGTGRFTGGGSLDLANGISLSNGLTLHCDLKLSNNLEVNWKDAQGNSHKFHIDEHFLTVACTDAPNILQPPPDAPLDTLIGKATGTFDNGPDSYTVEFTFVDGGEGKGAIDRVALRIFKTSTPSTVVLNFPLTDIIKGNLQAHFDQPHK